MKHRQNHIKPTRRVLGRPSGRSTEMSSPPSPPKGVTPRETPFAHLHPSVKQNAGFSGRRRLAAHTGSRWKAANKCCGRLALPNTQNSWQIYLKSKPSLIKLGNCGAFGSVKMLKEIWFHVGPERILNASTYLVGAVLREPSQMGPIHRGKEWKVRSWSTGDRHTAS